MRKYERMFERYAYPINATSFSHEDKVNVIAAVRAESNDIAVGKM